MREDAAFVEEIRRHPHDATPRLIYADFLEDQGDPRGEFIRVQCELDALPPGSPQRGTLFDREQELLDRHADEWLWMLRDLGVDGLSRTCFRGGLVERIRIDARRFLANAAALCEVAPALSAVALSGAADLADELAACALPPQIDELDLGSNRLAADFVWSVRTATWLRQLESLRLAFNRLDDEAASLLAKCDLRGLVALDLAANRIGPAGLRTLVDAAWFAGLERFDLQRNPIGDAGLEFLCRSANVAALKHLDVSACGIASLQPLVRSSRFESLRHLALRANRIDAAGWQGLDLSETGLRLESLDGRNNPASPPELPKPRA